jgi:hypothetical protein
VLYMYIVCKSILLYGNNVFIGRSTRYVIILHLVQWTGYRNSTLLSKIEKCADCVLSRSLRTLSLRL